MKKIELLILMIFLLVIANASGSPDPGAKLSVRSKSERQREYQIDVAGSNINVAFESDQINLSDEEILKWVSRSAQAVTAYYGRFPVGNLLVQLRPMKEQGIRGVTFGEGRATIIVSIGSNVIESDLNDDWVMTHEMVHCTFPSVDSAHAWLEEGIATYVEPLARLRTGELTAEKVWGDLARSLPQGLPKSGDRGLDHTPTWGRKYWGGALFCLLADIEIRQRTANRRGLEDALRGILQNEGNVAVEWELSRALGEGDRATGVPVLNELYQFMKATPIDVNLSALWESLGVELRGDTVIFNDNAPLASVRQAITNGK